MHVSPKVSNPMFSHLTTDQLAQEAHDLHLLMEGKQLNPEHYTITQQRCNALQQEHARRESLPDLE